MKKKPEIVHEPLDGPTRPRSGLQPLSPQKEPTGLYFTILVVLLGMAAFIVKLLFDEGFH